MKVVFFSYPASFQNVGGGEIVLLKLKEYLENLGITVSLFDMWRDKIEDFDILHIFGSVRDCLGLMRVAKARGVKVAISPIFWSSFQRALYTHESMKEKTDLFFRHLTKFMLPTFPSARRSMLIEADILFPNSEMEKKQLGRLFWVPMDKMRVIYNAADAKFCDACPEPFFEQFGREPFILSVGRIEPRKNQLNLIRAVKLFKFPLIFIGNPVSGYETYYRACRNEAPPYVKFFPGMKHGDLLLQSAYSASELFVLPAWFETPGLAALEAALAGTRVAVTRGGSTVEYFGNRVEYFEPKSPVQIAAAIQKSIKKPKMPYLRDHVSRCFTWDKIADETLSAYREVIQKKMI